MRKWAEVRRRKKRKEGRVCGGVSIMRREEGE